MTRTSTVNWRGIGRTALSLALSASGAALITTGHVLMVCGLQLQVLSARVDPE